MPPRIKYCETVERVQLIGLDTGKIQATVIMKDGTRLTSKSFNFEDFFADKDDARIFIQKKK